MSGFSRAVYVIPALGGAETALPRDGRATGRRTASRWSSAIMEKGVRKLSLVNVESGGATRLPVLAGGLGQRKRLPWEEACAFRRMANGYMRRRRRVRRKALYRCALAGREMGAGPLKGLTRSRRSTYRRTGSELVIIGRSQMHEAGARFPRGCRRRRCQTTALCSRREQHRVGEKRGHAGVRNRRAGAVAVPHSDPDPGGRSGRAGTVDVEPATSKTRRHFRPTADLCWSVPTGTAVSDLSSDADGNSPTQLTKLFGYTVGSPVWSPDGKRIAFDARVEGNPDIWVMNADGSQPQR